MFSDSGSREKGFDSKIVPLDTKKKILVRMPNWVGDLVMATPILTDLRRRYPDDEITVMCHAKLASLLEHDSDVDKIFTFSLPSGWERRKSLRALVEKLRAGRYDVGILLTNSFSSAWWFWRAGIKQRIGFRGNWRTLLLTDPVSCPRNIESQHLVQTYKSLLTPLGMEPSSSAPRLHLLPTELDQARALLKRLGVTPGMTVVGINPGAAFGSAKCWLPSRFAAVTRRLLEDPRIAVVFFGDASQVPLVKGICNEAGERALNLAGTTSLRQLAALIRLCDLLLTNDSGPMHLGAALGTPLVALFGSTNEVKTGPYGQGEHVIHKHVECSPCYLRTCPVDFRCMERITSDEVYQRLQALMRESAVSVNSQ